MQISHIVWPNIASANCTKQKNISHAISHCDTALTPKEMIGARRAIWTENTDDSAIVAEDVMLLRFGGDKRWVNQALLYSKRLVSITLWQCQCLARNLMESCYFVVVFHTRWLPVIQLLPMNDPMNESWRTVQYISSATRLALCDLRSP